MQNFFIKSAPMTSMATSAIGLKKECGKKSPWTIRHSFRRIRAAILISNIWPNPIHRGDNLQIKIIQSKREQPE